MKTQICKCYCVHRSESDLEINKNTVHIILVDHKLYPDHIVLHQALMETTEDWIMITG